MKIQYYIYSLLTLLSVSCGTMRGSSSIIPIDSTPRGIEVKDDKSKTIGFTPFFYKFPQNKEHVLKLTNNNSFKYSCSYNWASSILPNSLLAPVFPVGTLISAGFHLTDYITGSYVSCDQKIHIRLQKNKQALVVKKKRVIILPPRVDDEVVSDTIIENLEKRLKKKGIDVVPAKTAKQYFYLHNITHKRHNKPQNLNAKHFNKIAHQFHVTHILYMDTVEKDKHYSIKYKIQDAFNYTLPAKVNQITLSKVKFKKQGNFRKFMNYIDILPNSLTLSIQSNPSVTSVDSNNLLIESEIKRHPKSLPKALTVLGLKSVHNPMFFRSWDYKFSLSPSFNTSSWSSVDKQNDIVNIQSFNAYFGVQAMGQTPFGQFTLGYSLAAYYILSDNSVGQESEKLITGSKFSFDYKYFFNNRWYLILEANSHFLPTSESQLDNYRIQTWTNAYLGIGYYFPEIESFVSNLL